MKVIYYSSIFYLGAFAIVVAFPFFTRWHWLIKLAVALLAFVALILSIAYQHLEKKTEELDKRIAEMRDEQRTQVISKKLDDLKEKEKKGLFTDKDYLNRIALQLEELTINIESQSKLVRQQYLTAYFDEVAKIPAFYTWEEWKETEGILYSRILNGINGIFNLRGMFSSSERVALIDEFNKERDKYLKAKERQNK
ncbi:MAG: hypothetical protein COV71_05835 [Candidatus Omnitrophica bacterium CG11_big_fil_rev_8_21_14_0_20_41_12]|nr:MAG: hypothetical protein COV71_05835 [Candidatus Omnitrophica bacterium CG11_big_fil_rev_8_21_14_0_20_41_12]